ncbi:hypothetical protein DRO42_00885 [Candidatus Bathyarchaeota archaeon]|nr:MAG: hypothetical protein DRO42_00885 [Candidatus Bathyarchaeota archaeon]
MDYEMPPDERKQGFAILASTSVSYFVENFIRTAPSALMPILIEELGLTHGLGGLLVSSYFFLYALMQVPSGVLSDALGPRRTILGFTVFTIVGVFIFYLGHRLEILLVAQLLIGLGTSVFYINAVKIVSTWFSSGRRASAIGVLSATSGLGNFFAYIGFPLAMRLAWGWRGLYLLCSLLLVASFAANLFILRDRPHSEELDVPRRSPSIGRSFVRVIGERRMYPYLLGFVFSSFSWVFMSWLPQFLVDTRGFSYIDAGLVSSVATIMGIPGCILIGLISDHLKRRKLPLVAFSLAYTCLLAGFLALPGWMPLPLFAAVAACIGFSVSLWVLSFSMVPETLPPDMAGMGLGLLNGIGNLAFSLVAPVYGFLVDSSGSYLTSNAMLILGGVLMTVVYALFTRETYGGVGEP